MSSMTPTSKEEYNKRYTENMKFSGYGLETTTHYPCPFCGAPDWASAKLLENKEVLSKEHTCVECGRTAKTVFDGELMNLRLSMVQTGGNDPDEWVDWVRRA